MQMYVVVSVNSLISFLSTISPLEKQFYLPINALKSSFLKKEVLISSKKYILTLESKSNFILNHKLIPPWKVNLKRWNCLQKNKKNLKYNSVVKLKKLRKKLSIYFKTNLKLIFLSKSQIYYLKWTITQIGKIENKVLKLSFHLSMITLEELQ